MECLLILVVAATVLTGPQGKLTHAARTSPAEAFWRAALPGAPMPEAIRELLRPGAAGTNALDDARPRHHDADPPPLTFNYGDYKSTPRNEVAAPSAEVLDSVAGARNAAASSTVFFPGAPMPEAIRELLRPGAAGTDARPKYHDAEPPPLSFSYDVRPKHHDHDPPPLPPMNFNYDDYKSTPRNEAATPSAEVLDRVAGARNAAASLPTVFFLEEAVRVGGILPFPSIIPRGTANAAAAASPPLRLYTVRAVRAVEGCRFVVCRREAGPSSPGLGGDERDAVYGCLATGPSRAYVVGMVGERGETAAAAVVCRTDVSRWNRARAAAFWLLDVKPGGAAAVCHAALDAQVIPVKNNDRSSSLA